MSQTKEEKEIWIQGEPFSTPTFMVYSEWAQRSSETIKPGSICIKTEKSGDSSSATVPSMKGLACNLDIQISIFPVSILSFSLRTL